MNSTSEYDNAINLDDLMDKMNNNFNMSLKNTLSPFVDKVNTLDGNYRAISETLRKIPEFRDLVSENAALKKELAELKVSYAEYPSVTLEVTEKEGNNEDTNTLVQQVYTDVDGQFLDADDDDTDDTDDSNIGVNDDENNIEGHDEEDKEDDEDKDDENNIEGHDEVDKEDEDKEDEDNEDEDEDEDKEDDDKEDDDKEDDDKEDEDNEDDDNEDEDNEDEDNEDEDNEDDECDKPLVARSVSSIVRADEEDGSDDDEDDDDEDNDDDDDEEVFLVEIEGKGTFYTTDETSGIIYNVEDDDEVGDRVGVFSNGKEVFD
jgi:hypothetical protein